MELAHRKLPCDGAQRLEPPVHVVQIARVAVPVAREPHVLQGLRGGQSVARIRLQHALEQIARLGRHGVPLLAVQVKVSVADQLCELVLIRVVKGQRALEERVHAHPQRPHVHARPVGPLQQNLGRRVPRRAASVLHLLTRPRRLGQAKVHYGNARQVSGLGKHKVLQLQVAMDAVVRVHVGDCVHQTLHNGAHVALAVAVPQVEQRVHELGPSQVVHDDVHVAVLVEVLLGAHYVLVLDHLHQLDLVVDLLQRLEAVLFALLGHLHDLDGEHLARGTVNGLPHHREAACADGVSDAVLIVKGLVVARLALQLHEVAGVEEGHVGGGAERRCCTLVLGLVTQARPATARSFMRLGGGAQVPRGHVASDGAEAARRRTA
mmetsp:Transcript_8346/g.30791  ORF Transcript_8346/g.30791 Transcript_8346/m.30791 type:complete len:378 (+) Transcript_8346:661-1794(+)